MSEKMKKLFALILTTLLVTTMAVSAFASEAGACKGIVPKVEAGSVVIDGTKDAAYDNALCVDINQFLSGADLGTYGKAYMLWTDGSYYLFVEVFDEDVATPSENAHLNSPWTTDSVEMFFDFSNEAVGLAEQYRIDCTGYPSYYIQDGAYFAYGPEDAKEYFDEYAAAKTDVGYNIEMRVNLKEALEDYELKEGNSIGLQLQINDCVEGGGDSTIAVYNMDSSLNAGSWDVDKYDYVTLGGYLENTAETEPETEAAPETEAETVAETEAETTAPETEAETEAAEETVETSAETTAPQTFDMGVIAAALAAVSAAGYAVSKKRK